MAKTPRRELALAHRREQVVDLYLQGWTQGAIAKQLGVAQATISSDLKAIRQLWQDSAVRDFDVCREIEIQKLNRIEREAWAAWERSQKPAQSARFDEGGLGGRSQKTVRNQYGDPRFLEIALRCNASRRALLGLDVQPAIVQNNLTIQLSSEERERHIAALLGELGTRLLPTSIQQGEPRDE